MYQNIQQTYFTNANMKNNEPHVGRQSGRLPTGHTHYFVDTRSPPEQSAKGHAVYCCWQSGMGETEHHFLTVTEVTAATMKSLSFIGSVQQIIDTYSAVNFYGGTSLNWSDSAKSS